MDYQAELICVGTELMQGDIANTDAQMVSQALSALGVRVVFHTAVGDDAERITQATEIARKRANLLVYIGGLGPTYDDFTMATVAKAFGRKTVFFPQAKEDMQHYFDAVFHKEMPECNLQQAYLPEGCEMFRNFVGTAPGCCFEEENVTVMLLPGVPRECRDMLEHHVLPWLRERTGGTMVEKDIHTFGLNEPQLQEMLGSVMTGAVNPAVNPYARDGEVLVHLTARGEDEAACEHLLEPVIAKIRALLGDYIYSENRPSLEAEVVALLKEKGLTCTTAESLTGGLIAKRITDVPGASSVFLGGIVSYTNGVKAAVLGVPEEVLEEFGAVSEPVAKAMAEGARRITGADIAVAVTGVAGPDRDDRGNDVGTVFLGLATKNGTQVKRLALGGDRAWIRQLTVHHALDNIRRTAAGMN